MNYVEIVKCRTCHSERLLEVLDLGIQPLANALKANADNGNEPKYPLRLVQCAVCGLIQIDVNVSP